MAPIAAGTGPYSRAMADRDSPQRLTTRAAETFRFERSWVFPVGSEQLWATLEHTDDYPRWWSWLRSVDPVALRPGAHTCCVIAAPLPYRLHVTISVDTVVPGRLVLVHIGGDLEGDAALRLEPGVDTCRASLRWELRVRRPLLRRAARTVRPVLEWGHERVVEIGVTEFVERALGEELRVPLAQSLSVTDVLAAAAAAGILSGAPSTVAALLRGHPLTQATRAAGTLLGRPTIGRGLAAHALLSVGWAAALARVLPRQHTAAWGGAAGLAIAALDLGVVGRRLPAVRELAVSPQVADHLAFGVVTGAVIAQRSLSR